MRKIARTVLITKSTMIDDVRVTKLTQDGDDLSLFEDFQRAATDVINVVNGVTLVNHLLTRCAKDGLHVERDRLKRVETNCNAQRFQPKRVGCCNLTLLQPWLAPAKRESDRMSRLR